MWKGRGVTSGQARCLGSSQLSGITGSRPSYLRTSSLAVQLTEGRRMGRRKKSSAG